MQDNAQVFDTIPDGKIVDFIDGKIRNKTPEEYVRQNVERSLVQEYRYLREDIAVEFRIKVGSARKAADLVIFPEGKQHSQENAWAIIECKKEGTKSRDRREGIEQLKSYMAASVNVRYGVWTNGSDERICFQKVSDGAGHDFIECIDIPQKGDAEKDADVPDRRKLRPATGDNLRFAFKRCHNYIAGNQGLQKPEAFWELLKVIFCKIEDERSLEPLRFYVSNREQRNADGQLKCKKRVDALFEAVRRQYATIFKPSDSIELNRTVLAYVVSQLQIYSLLESPVDVKGIAYEEIVGSNLRGDRGEFFTPRNACRMAVEMLAPGIPARVIDPACGTAGFLITAMNRLLEKLDDQIRAKWTTRDRPSEREQQERYLLRQRFLSESVVGLDINPNLIRAAKMNMVMNNDGAGGLFQSDSLRDPSTWDQEARVAAPFGSFDYAFTNPPFGTNIRIDAVEVLQQYDLAAVWDFDQATARWKKRLGATGDPILQKSQPPEILFIERCLMFVKPGIGRMAIVLPNGILNNPPLGYVRQWLLEEAQVLAVVDMQRDLFQPHNDTQTSMICLRRKSPAEKAQDTSGPIFMAVTDKIGHDKRGNTIYKRNPDGTDIVALHEVVVDSVEGGKAVKRAIQEKTLLVDDQLPEIPPLFHSWAQLHGIE